MTNGQGSHVQQREGSRGAGGDGAGSYRRAIEGSIAWFQRSGIMRPSDGFWGVAERLLLTENNPAAENTLQYFAYHSSVAPGMRVLEHRRPDCNFQTALLFDLAADYLGMPELHQTCDHIVDFLFNRCGLYDINPESSRCGLWQWAQPFKGGACYWTDDMAWVITILLLLARRGRPHLRSPALATARALHVVMKKYFADLQVHGRNHKVAEDQVMGLRLNPHWAGLVTMAFAHAQQVDPDTDYTDVVLPYYQRYALAGPPDHDSDSRRAAGSLPWSLSEYAYLALTASIAADAFQLEPIQKVARQAADILLQRQCPDGHFPSEHYEAPAQPHLADLIYTDNWALLGLYHAARLDGADPSCARAFERSLSFLARIQDQTDTPHLAGCWRGMYDTALGSWGGGNHNEGGAASIYSGWTNAPIALGFLFAATGSSLLAMPRGRESGT